MQLTPRSSLLPFPLHPRQSLRDPLKQRLDIMSHLGTRLDEHKIMLLGLLLALRGGNFPLLIQIRLIPDQDNNDIVPALAAHVVDPFPGLLEGFLRGDVVDDDGDGGVADIGGDEGAEAFLARRVPELEADGAVFEVHGFGEEVDADGGLVGGVEGVVHEAGDEGGFAD